MKVVFPNSATVSTRQRLILAKGSFARESLSVRYGIVIHPEFGPILIDTGYTPHAVSAKNRSLPLRAYSRVLSPKLNLAQQPEAALKHLGFTPEDIKFVIVTHFHADHVSGLSLFPNARFIVNGSAWDHVAQSGAKNIAHGVFPELLPPDFASRTQRLKDCAQTPDGADIFGDASLIAIPLPGHAKGHFGVRIAAPKPLLYAVDTQWLIQALREDRPAGFPATVIMDDPAAYRRSTKQVMEQMATGMDIVLCHDPQPTAYDFAR